MKQYLLPERGAFYKVNMHCHSICSDGDQTPEQIKEAFLAQGYSAVAFTEHEMMRDFSYLTDERFVAITAYEYAVDSDENMLSAVYDGAPMTRNHTETVHLNFFSMDPHDTRMVCFNPKYVWGNAKNYLDEAQYVGTPDYERCYTPEGINEVIRAAKERNMLVVYNHPEWSLNTYEIYNRLEGVDGLELINGDSYRCMDMDCVPNVYADMARAGQRLICVGGDDNHHLSSCGAAWTVVKADRLSYTDIMEGLRQGNCYASTGPEIHSLYVEDGKLHVTTSEAVGIYLYTAGRRTASVRAGADGTLCTKAEFELKPKDLFFRLSVRDTRGNHAYTRYYYLDELFQAL